jgi:hypothetical protein
MAADTVTVRLAGNPWMVPVRVSERGALTLTYTGPARPVVIVMPWIPDEIEVAGLAQVWEQIPRPGGEPLQVSRGKALRTHTFTCLLADPDLAQSVTPIIDALTAAADSEQPAVAALGPRLLGQVTITGLSVRETEWGPSSQPVEATVSIELTKASTVPDSIGPVPRKRGLPKAAHGSARNMAGSL